MAGLLNYNPDPVGMGLLSAGAALMTPRAMGGGLGPGLLAFNQGAMQAQMMQRQQAQDAIREQMMRERMDMDRQKFGFEKDQYLAQIQQQRQNADRMGEVEQWVTQNRPELLPAFKLNPTAVASQLLPQKPQTVTLKPGERLYAEGQYDRPLAEVPDKPPAPTDLSKMIGEMNALPPGSPMRALYENAIRKATTHAPAASLNVSYGAPFEGVGPDGRAMLFQPSNRGGPPLATGLAAPPKAGAKPTEDENRSAGLAVRMEDALRTLTGVTSKNPGAATPPLVQSLVGRVSETAANAITPVDRQRVEAAQLDALDAALTLATGAAYTKEQLAGLSKAYFPQIGDKPQTISEKQARLAKVIETARIRAGTAAPNIDRVLGGSRAAPGAAAQPTPGGPGAILRFDAQGNLLSN